MFIKDILDYRTMIRVLKQKKCEIIYQLWKTI